MLLDKIRVHCIAVKVKSCYLIELILEERSKVGIKMVWPFNRSRCSQMFFKIDIPKNFTIFTGKHLHWTLFLVKFQA